MTNDYRSHIAGLCCELGFPYYDFVVDIFIENNFVFLTYQCMSPYFEFILKQKLLYQIPLIYNRLDLFRKM